MWAGSCVRVQAEERLVSQADYNHEYLPIEGYAPFNVRARGILPS